jgi:hypothetical protein
LLRPEVLEQVSTSGRLVDRPRWRSFLRRQADLLATEALRKWSALVVDGFFRRRAEPMTTAATPGFDVLPMRGLVNTGRQAGEGNSIVGGRFVNPSELVCDIAEQNRVGRESCDVLFVACNPLDGFALVDP